MNIGFGAASADLAAVLDLHVVLSVPSISIVAATELLAYLQKEIRDYSKASVIEQNFWSGFKGVALVVFSAGSGKGLVAVFGREEGASLFESDPIGALDKEVLMEVGNILVGACVGKVAELLGDIVTSTLLPGSSSEFRRNQSFPQCLRSRAFRHRTGDSIPFQR